MRKSEVDKILSYDQITGIFKWKVNVSGIAQVGDIAGSKTSEGYTVIQIKGRKYKAHRLAFLIIKGYMPKFVDHKDTDRSNTAWHNLRECTKSQNQHNSKTPSNNTSGVKGLTFNKSTNKWVARISVNGKSKYLGQFSDTTLAEAALSKARAEFHGAFANNGGPN